MRKEFGREEEVRSTLCLNNPLQSRRPHRGRVGSAAPFGHDELSDDVRGIAAGGGFGSITLAFQTSGNQT
jgi:hypothetical protein